jgi:hypothetical protein
MALLGSDGPSSMPYNGARLLIATRISLAGGIVALAAPIRKRREGNRRRAGGGYSATSVRMVQRKMICRQEVSSTKLPVRSKCS